jgi:hypothetical protein
MIHFNPELLINPWIDIYDRKELNKDMKCHGVTYERVEHPDTHVSEEEMNDFETEEEPEEDMRHAKKVYYQ